MPRHHNHLCSQLSEIKAILPLLNSCNYCLCVSTLEKVLIEALEFAIWIFQCLI